MIYMQDVVIHFVAILLVCVIFFIVPKLAWLFLLFKLFLLIFLKITKKRYLFGFEFKHLDKTMKYIISLLVIYFLNVIIFSNIVGDYVLWYYISTSLIYISATTTLTTRFGEKLEEKCILCHKFKFLNLISFPIFSLNFIIVFGLYYTVLYTAVEKWGIVLPFWSAMLLSSIVTLCWQFRNKIEPKLSIPFALFITLTIIHIYVFGTGVF